MHAAAHGGARDGARARRDLARASRCSTTSATPRATSGPCCSRRSTPRARHRRADRPARARARACRTWSPTTTLDVTVHDGFGYWVADVEDQDAGLQAALEQANASATRPPGSASVEAAYWTNVGPKEHLRWVMPEPEDDAARRPGPAARGRAGPASRRARAWSACSAPTACWCRSGTSRSAPAPRRSRSPPRRFAADLDEALADTARPDLRSSAPPAPAWPTGRSRSAKESNLTSARDLGGVVTGQVGFHSPGRCCLPRQQRPGIHISPGPPGHRRVAGRRLPAGTLATMTIATSLLAVRPRRPRRDRRRLAGLAGRPGGPRLGLDRRRRDRARPLRLRRHAPARRELRPDPRRVRRRVRRRLARLGHGRRRLPARPVRRRPAR